MRLPEFLTELSPVRETLAALEQRQKVWMKRSPGSKLMRSR